MTGTVLHTIVESPIGDLLVTGDGASVTGLYTPGHGRTPAPTWVRADDAFAPVRRQLDEYFAGTRREFDVPISVAGTAFQEAVWKQLREIGYGQTASYSELATRVGSPAAVRAVGSANGRNPVSIIVGCHRVIGADGSLTGYAGGLDAKRWLLAHERAHAARGVSGGPVSDWCPITSTAGGPSPSG